MNRNGMKKVLSLLLCVVLIAAMALTATGCSGEPVPSEQPQNSQQTPSPTEMGEGETVFYFTVVDTEGKQTAFKIRTNETTVGAALVAQGLIEGEEGPYGLYVKTVLGITLDYEKDGKYWAFYENDTAALTGVDQTNIIPDATYAFKAE